MNKKILLFLIPVIFVFCLIPNFSKADTEDITVTRSFVTDDGSIRFVFSGYEFDESIEYSFALTESSSTDAENWYDITEWETGEVTIDLTVNTSDFRKIIFAYDTGYITIRETESETVVIDHYSVDLSTPYLRVTNYAVLENGTEFSTSNTISTPLRSPSYVKAYYQYVEITDEAIISAYKEIKENDGDYYDLQDILSDSPPTSGYTTWSYFNGYSLDGLGGYGYPEATISVPDEGLYYMWIYFNGATSSSYTFKTLYGCILIDNLTEDSSSSTSDDDSNSTTNSSSDDTDNTSSSSTSSDDTDNTSSSSSSDDENNASSSSNSSSSSSTDNTTSSESLPYTGLTNGIYFIVIIIIGAMIIAYIKYKKLKGI